MSARRGPARAMASLSLSRPAYQISLFLVIFSAQLSLILTRELHPAHVLIMTVLLFAAAFGKGLRRLPAWTVNAFIILVLCGALAVALAPPRGLEAYFHAIAYFLVYTLLIRYLTRKTPRDDLFVFLLALLEVCASAIMTISLSFLPALIFFTAAITAGLMLFSINHELRGLAEHRRRIQGLERHLQASPPGRTPPPGQADDPPPSVALPPWFAGFAGAFALAVFALGFSLFFIIPRVGRGLFTWKGGIHPRVSGFAETVEFGSLGKIKLSNRLVMRVEMEGAGPDRGPFYFRGNALDRFDGTTWSDSLGFLRIHYLRYQGTITLDRIASLRNTVKQDIILEPIETPILFGMPRIMSLSVPFQFRAVLQYGNDYLSLPLDSPLYDRIIYTVWSAQEPQGVSACHDAMREGKPAPESEFASAYLMMPPGLEKAAELAKSIAGQEADPCERAGRVRDYLLANYAYSLDTPSDSAPDPIPDFLFKSRTGYCQHFASAMVLMLRALGQPSRIANGYLAGDDFNPIDHYLSVRESDAHTWVEMLLPNGQWVMFDPTPPVQAPPPLPAWARPLRDLFDSLKYRWDRYVVDLNLRDQYRMAFTIRERGIMATRGLAALPARSALVMKSLLRSSPLVLVIPALAVLYFLWVKKSLPFQARPSQGAALAIAARKEFLALLRALERKGIPRREAETALELVRRIEDLRLPFARLVRQATHAYLELRFGPPAPDTQAILMIREAMKAVNKLTR